MSLKGRNNRRVGRTLCLLTVGRCLPHVDRGAAQRLARLYTPDGGVHVGRLRVFGRIEYYGAAVLSGRCTMAPGGSKECRQRGCVDGFGHLPIRDFVD